MDKTLQSITGASSSYNRYFVVILRGITKKQNFLLVTSQLNQDMWENFFSIIGQWRSYNSNPTCRVFWTTFRIQCIGTLLDLSTIANCEDDEGNFLQVWRIKNTYNICFSDVLERTRYRTKKMFTLCNRSTYYNVYVIHSYFLRKN